jgi:hypothetical protein
MAGKSPSGSQQNREDLRQTLNDVPGIEILPDGTDR